MRRFPMLAALAGLLTLGVTAAALSDSDDGPGRLPMVTDALTAKSCSECHMAYPPQFLPPESWHAIMSDLRNHFGTDAHFDPATTAAIEAYLIANAKPVGGIDPANPPLKITQMPWWIGRHAGMHGRGSPNPKIDPMANCQACHNGLGGGEGGDD